MLKPHHNLMEAIQEGRRVTDKSAREALALMLFGNDDLPKTIELLSGGEKARVRLAQLLLDKPNVLVLDEPTNHLDIASREALEAALGQFDGTILCVSHDRYFLGSRGGSALGAQSAEFEKIFSGNLLRLD